MSNNKHPTESFQRKNATSDLWDQRSRELQLQMYTTVRRHGHGVCAPDLTFHDMTFPPHGNGMAHRPLNGRPPPSLFRCSSEPSATCLRAPASPHRKAERHASPNRTIRRSLLASSCTNARIRPPCRPSRPASLRALDRGVGELIMPALPRRSALAPKAKLLNANPIMLIRPYGIGSFLCASGLALPTCLI